MFSTDTDSERAASIEDYQNTCTEFITDISKDYKDWVDKYNLTREENGTRKRSIDSIVKTTNDWIFKYGNTIKKIDIIMNDGISKMAENTAGYPFKFEVFVNNVNRYIIHPSGEVRLNVRATPRQGRLAQIGSYEKDNLLLINSSSPVTYAFSSESFSGADILNDYIVVDARNCQKHDIISITIIVEESNGKSVMERRGYSSLILVS
jgi:hypothetical protein